MNGERGAWRAPTVRWGRSYAPPRSRAIPHCGETEKRRRNMPTTDAILAQAWQHQQAGNLDQAETLYRQVLEVEPHSLNALYLLAVVCQIRGRAEESIPLYQRAMQIKPDSAEVQNNLGAAYASLGRLNEALTCYQEAVRLKPDHAEAYHNLGYLQSSQGDWDQAIASYQKALALRPQYPEALNGLGIVYCCQQRVDEALASFQKALALRPQYAEALNNLGNAWLSKGNPREAENCFRQTLRYQPNNAQAYSNLGVVYTELQQWEEALACWQQSLACNPLDPQAHRNLGNAWNIQGQYDKALGCYQQVLALCPDDVHIRLLVEAMRGESSLAQLPADYVTTLFDAFAPSFDQNLVEQLRYCGPALLRAVLEPAPPSRSLAVLDLGCGTGLCGVQFRDWARTLIGVDLSAKMLDKARQRSLYDELIVSDLLIPLHQNEGKFDLILAGDVFVYTGDLETIFAAVARALRPGGRFAFTVELLEGTGYRLQSTIRFAHSRDYLQGLTVRTQLQQICMNEEVLRTEHGQGVAALVVVLSRLQA